ncbi:hypothetical protein JCM10212_004864 [Sporobolomyces blumeae]
MGATRTGSSESKGPDGLGIGKPVVAVDRRDITIKPCRHAPRPPSDSLPNEPDSPSKPYHVVPYPLSPRSPSEPISPSAFPHPPSSTPATTTRATAAVSHPPISPPQYLVRSQPIGLVRSHSLDEVANTPTISGGLTRRLSVSSLSSEGGDDDESTAPIANPKPVNRPLFKHRSESLPSFPPQGERRDVVESRKSLDEDELARLPANPKMWLPSHLAVYLSNALSLHPALAADITAFIRTSRLSGRTFLRLKHADLEELGVNVRWQAALLETGDRLRREALGGRIFWGFEGPRQDESDSPARAQSSLGLSYPSSLQRTGSHRRRPSIEVEGSASEDDSSKEEWKRSWRRLNRGTNRVKGLAKTFETVIETSERSINLSRVGSPCSSPDKARNEPRASRIWPGTESGVGGFFAGRDASPAQRTRTDSTESTLSAASIDSFSGRYASSPVQPLTQAASLDSTPSLAPESSSPETGSSPRIVGPVTPIKKKDSARDVRVSFADDFDWAIYDDSPGIRKRLARSSTSEVLGRDEDRTVSEGDEDEDEEERTLKPVRTGSSASGGSSGKYAPFSPVSTEKRAGLADLFGLDVPKTKKPTRDEEGKGKGFDDGDEMVPMMVPGVDDEGPGGRKGSMVLIKRSQFAALQQRMQEVEAQVALALESNGVQSPRKSGVGKVDGDKENAVDRFEGRLIGLEHQTRLLASLSPERQPLRLRQPASASRQRFPSHDETGTPALLPEEFGWKTLSGYIVAASIGIGIVAGEVVAAKLFGIRRR